MRVVAILTFVAGIFTLSGSAQVKDFVPVTQAMLENPRPDDWLMVSRTYDAQRFSPLGQITRENVGRLRMVWTRGLVEGQQQTTPLVYRGVMYVSTPGASVQALDATTGDLIWEYKRPGARGGGQLKNLSIFDDLVFYSAPDSTVVALDARSGTVRWEAKVDLRTNSGGSLVAEGKVITSGSCGTRASCYISAHDARTGKEVWRFYTAAGDDDPGGKTWGTVPEAKRVASTWGLPGSYDPARRTLYWGAANPVPYTRRERHDGKPDEIPRSSPADLYSNSTLALDPATGKLKWYYQYGPGDDWDQDGNQERVLVRTPLRPDPRFVKWINPRFVPGEVRDVVLNIPEGGGLWALDRDTGRFVWATPFPNDDPNFYISKIDVETGQTFLNEALLVSDFPGQRKTICFWNTKSYWASAYDARKNVLYAPYINNCVDMTSPIPAVDGKPAVPQRRIGALASDRKVDPQTINGLARINVATGEIQRWHVGPIPTNGSVLATAGDLLFWGDLNRRFRAFDADTGAVVWESIIGGPVTTSTITYAVNGKQYVAVMSGATAADEELVSDYMAPVKLPIRPSYNHNAIYVFALP